MWSDDDPESKSPISQPIRIEKMKKPEPLAQLRFVTLMLVDLGEAFTV